MTEIMRKVVLAESVLYSPGPGDLAQIRGFAGREIPAEQLYVRTLVLCTGDLDRDSERFSEEVLTQFAETIVGKSLLIGHQHDSLPEGLFYRAEVVPRSGRAPAVQAWFYMVRTDANEHLRAQMDGGVLRYASIGFHCDRLVCDLCGRAMKTIDCVHKPGLEYDGVHATGTWQGRAEALEGSLVYLGAQYDAMILKWYSADAPPSPRAACEMDDLEERVTLLTKALEETRREADALRAAAVEGAAFRKALRDELRALCALSGDAVVWQVLEPNLDSYSAAELRDMCDRVRRGAELPREPCVSGARAPRGREPDLSAYVKCA